MFSGFNDYNELGPYDRCITRGVLGSTFPVIYNNGNQILQMPGYVVIRNEMIHETRVIPLDGRPHAARRRFARYMGDPRGHWEGNTLVVDTTNFNGRTGAQANGNLLMTSDALELAERFTRTGPDTHPVRGHGHRSEDVDETVGGAVPAEARPELQDLRIRVPRGEPRDVEHPVGIAGGRKELRGSEVRQAGHGGQAWPARPAGPPPDPPDLVRSRTARSLSRSAPSSPTWASSQRRWE